MRDGAKINQRCARQLSFVYTGPLWAVGGVIGAIQRAGDVLAAPPRLRARSHEPSSRAKKKKKKWKCRDGGVQIDPGPVFRESLNLKRQRVLCDVRSIVPSHLDQRISSHTLKHTQSLPFLCSSQS